MPETCGTEYGCLVCEVCGTKKPPPPGDKNPPAGEKQGKLPKNPNESYIEADSNRVYLLGDLDGERQLDIYSGLNGFHVKTIPGYRWEKPVMVGAGAGYIAMVSERGAGCIIHVTDSQGGAPDSWFDADGFPKDDKPWATAATLFTKILPMGVNGLTILPMGVLVAFLDSGGYLLWDLFTPANPLLDTYRKLPAPFNGTLHGTPAMLATKVHKNMWKIACILQDSTGGFILILDIFTGKVVASQALPPEVTAQGIAITNSSITVLADQFFVRCGFNRETGILSDYYLVSELPVDKGYMIQDLPGFVDFQAQLFSRASIPRYLRTASGFTLGEPSPEASSIDITKLAVLDTPASSLTLNDNMAPYTIVGHPAPYKGFPVKLQRLDIPRGTTIKHIENGYGVTTLIFDGSDTEKPLFRILDGTDNQWLIEGGYTYGHFDSVTGKFSGTTNGLVPV